MDKIRNTMQLMFCILVIAGCNQSKIKPIPFLNNGQDWDKSVLVLGDWDDNPETPYTYLHWAPVNVGYDASGEIASKYDCRVGRLYQWGSGDAETNKLAKEKYYNEQKPKFWYTNLEVENRFTGKLWNNAHGPCPNGWRLPTATEFKKLIVGKQGRYGWSSSSHYAGTSLYKGAEFFGMNKDLTPGTGVFLPAAGYLRFDSGYAFDFGKVGAYWSSDAKIDVIKRDNSGKARIYRGLTSTLVFDEDSCDVQDKGHAWGYSVRCVHDVE